VEATSTPLIEDLIEVMRHLGFYNWKLKSQFITLIYEQSRYIHPQWLGKKVE